MKIIDIVSVFFRYVMFSTKRRKAKFYACANVANNTSTTFDSVRISLLL